MASININRLKQVVTSPAGIGMIGLVALAGYFLGDKLSAFFAANLSLILILGACLGMHFFMHGSHGSKSKGNSEKSNGREFDKDEN